MCQSLLVSVTGPSVLECIDSDSLPKVETSLPGQMMVAMATLSVTSGVMMSSHCADSSKAKIVENLQAVTESLKQVCDNPETFDLIIADAGANMGTSIAQEISEVMKLLLFSL